MLFLADESCDFAVVRALRSAGHDVQAVTEIAPGAEDDHVLRLATASERILLTEDRDFGRLVYAHRQETGGLMLLRYPGNARRDLARDVVRLVKSRGQSLVGRFVVMEPGRVRISTTP